MPVTFSYADAKLPFVGKAALKRAVAELFIAEGCVLQQLDYVFCTDVFLININRQFLQHDDYTDIITFNLTEAGLDNGIVGEVYISVERVKDNAAKHGQVFSSEVLRVVFHGALHLCGYNDKRKDDKEVMRRKEDFYIQQYLNG
ncbi:MAG: rRNA maturation RNase YbeY [Bacteroidetes bacterium]|nr:MAG: rRNA maturation RNase YbeY [Bacteroidota bacterium]